MVILSSTGHTQRSRSWVLCSRRHPGLVDCSIHSLPCAMSAVLSCHGFSCLCPLSFFLCLHCSVCHAHTQSGFREVFQVRISPECWPLSGWLILDRASPWRVVELLNQRLSHLRVCFVTDFRHHCCSCTGKSEIIKDEACLLFNLPFSVWKWKINWFWFLMQYKQRNWGSWGC